MIKNIILFSIFIIIIVLMSGGSFRTLKDNTDKATEKTVQTLEDGTRKFKGR